MTVYQFDHYKKYFIHWIEQQPKKGHGEYRRLALHLNVSTTLISQIFNGDKDMSLEMAAEICDYLHLSDEESDYFLLLVEHAKAGSHKLKLRLNKQIHQRQEKAKKLESRMKKETELDDSAKTIYYSNWVYCAIRVLSDVPGLSTIEHLSERLMIPKNQLLKFIDFLTKNKLVISKGGQLSMGPSHIYLPPSDPLSLLHHQNWRTLGFQKMQIRNEENFFFSGQYSLSEDLAFQVRKELPDLIESIIKRVKPSKSETTRCLNIDFYEF